MFYNTRIVVGLLMIDPRQTLIGRDAERARLAALLAHPGASLALVTGRRRVGKTYLLARAWPSESTFLFTATRTTPTQNRRQLILDLATWTGEALDPDDYPSWRSVFDLVWRTRPGVPLAVVLDEFQYLAADEAGLAEVTSALNATLERSRADRPLVVALSGSAVSTLDALASGGAPLYGRLALHLRLEPLAVHHVATFTPAWAPREVIAAYGMLGGTPAYWALLDATSPLLDNVTGLLLARDGRLRQLIDAAILQEEGLGDTAAYTAIVRAIANGKVTRSRIADATGLSPDPSLVRRLDRLTTLGIVGITPVEEAPRNAPVRYHLVDPALRFHHAFVTPNASLLERAEPREVMREVVAPRLDTFLGPAFERLAGPTYDRLRGAAGWPMVERWSRWEGADRERRALEVDLVAPLVGGGVMTGSVKWNRRPLGAEVFQAHLDHVRRAADAGLRWAHAGRQGPVLFLAAGGVDDRFAAIAKAHPDPVIVLTADDVVRREDASV